MNLRQPRDFLTRVPFNTLLGMRIRRVHRDGVTIDCTLRDDLRNSAGVAHGGVTATMADAEVGTAIQRHFGHCHLTPLRKNRNLAHSPEVRIWEVAYVKVRTLSAGKCRRWKGEVILVPPPPVLKLD